MTINGFPFSQNAWVNNNPGLNTNTNNNGGGTSISNSNNNMPPSSSPSQQLPSQLAAGGANLAQSMSLGGVGGAYSGGVALTTSMTTGGFAAQCQQN